MVVGIMESPVKNDLVIEKRPTKYLQKRPTEYNEIPDTNLATRMPMVVGIMESPVKNDLIIEKRPIYQKRPTNKAYKKDLQKRPTKYLQKRPTQYIDIPDTHLATRMQIVVGII